MNLSHHPDDSSLASFAAGAVASNFACVMQLHLDQCPRCRERVEEAEALGGILLDLLPANAAAATVEWPTFEPERAATAVDEPPLQLPPLLQSFDRSQVDSLPWRRIAPGVRQLRFDEVAGDLYLLRIAPGTCLPHHGHGGSEMTLVLSGSYSDELGRFTPGNLSDLDGDTEHQPIADRNEDCICLVATDAPLRFKGLIPRLFQHLLRI